MTCLSQNFIFIHFQWLQMQIKTGKIGTCEIKGKTSSKTGEVQDISQVYGKGFRSWGRIP